MKGEQEDAGCAAAFVLVALVFAMLWVVSHMDWQMRDLQRRVGHLEMQVRTLKGEY